MDGHKSDLYFFLTIKFTNLNYGTLQVADETKVPEGAMTPVYFLTSTLVAV